MIFITYQDVKITLYIFMYYFLLLFLLLLFFFCIYISVCSFYINKYFNLLDTISSKNDFD